MKKVFDADYYEKYKKAGILDRCGGDLVQIIRWTGGGFGMACHNYDGDMLTDEVAQVHRSPGFITSSLIGKSPDGNLIKEFEASHGTVADLWHAHLRGEETSMNPLGMVVALLDAMNHAAVLEPTNKDEIFRFTKNCKEAVYQTFQDGRGTRDLSGPNGSTTEEFVNIVAENLTKRMAGEVPAARPVQKKEIAPSRRLRKAFKDVDEDAMKKFFDKYDVNADGSISFEEFEEMAVELNIAPLKPDASIREQQQRANLSSMEIPS